MPTSQEQRTWGQLARLPVKEETGTSRPITAKDANTCVEFTNAGAITVTIEPIETRPGISLLLKRGASSGAVSIVAGAGMTVESASGNYDITSASGIVTVYYLDIDRVVIAGDL